MRGNLHKKEMRQFIKHSTIHTGKKSHQIRLLCTLPEVIFIAHAHLKSDQHTAKILHHLALYVECASLY